jgi:hypothetical protein
MSDKSKKESEFSFTHLLLTPFKAITLSLEVFIRKDIGERYFSPLDLLMTIVLMGVLVFAFSESYALFDTWLFTFFLCSFVAMGIIHISRASRRHKTNTEIHSYYAGEPLLSKILNMGEDRAKMYGEPAILLLLGILFVVGGKYIYYPTYGLGLYMIVGALFMLLKAQLEYYMQRTKYLDTVDSKIESEVLSDALEGKPASHNKGFSKPGPKMGKESARTNIEQMYRKLDGSLQNLMENDKGNETQKEPEPKNTPGRTERTYTPPAEPER